MLYAPALLSKLSSSTTDPNNSSIAYNFSWRLEGDRNRRQHHYFYPQQLCRCRSAEQSTDSEIPRLAHTYRVVASTSSLVAFPTLLYFAGICFLTNAWCQRYDASPASSQGPYGAPGEQNHRVQWHICFAATPRIITGGGFQLPALTVDNNFAKTYKWTKRMRLTL